MCIRDSDWLTQVESHDYEVESFVTGFLEAKYHEYEDQMLELSRRYPKVVFTVCGHGEDPMDVWEHHFKNGKQQYCSVTIEQYDENKLK